MGVTPSLPKRLVGLASWLRLTCRTKQRRLQPLQQALQQQEVKLTEAQQTQAELLRKQRELDDARREVDRRSGRDGGCLLQHWNRDPLRRNTC